VNLDQGRRALASSQERFLRIQRRLLESLASYEQLKELAEAPDTDRPWVGVIVINLHKDLLVGRWQQLAAAEFAVRATFNELDTLPAALAQQRKIDLLRSLGY
jgi:hypothetical protein